jgi:hypothetical protein
LNNKIIEILKKNNLKKQKKKKEKKQQQQQKMRIKFEKNKMRMEFEENLKQNLKNKKIIEGEIKKHLKLINYL